MRISDWSSDVCSSDLGRFVLTTPQGRLTARQVIVATNGYTEDDRLPALSGRLMPAQSSIIVTRPLSPAEQEAQGWTSTVTCADTRRLLHYFPLLPAEIGRAPCRERVCQYR